MIIDNTGRKLELVNVPFQTTRHCCDRCFYHEEIGPDRCDEFLNDIQCGVTKVYQEVK